MNAHIGTRGGNVADDVSRARAVARLMAAFHTPRIERAWTAQVAVPLVMIATALSGLWVAWPLLIFASWWWTPSWNWAWLTVLVTGPFGTQWAYAGAVSFTQFPSHFVTVAVVWVVVPALLAASGHVNRRLIGHKEWHARV